MLDNYLKDLIDKGYDNNLIVYDYDAEPGVFTKRLVYLMKQICRENYLGDLKDLYLSPNLKLSHNLHGSLFEQKELIKLDDYCKIYGVTLKFEKGLNAYFHQIKYATLAHDDENVIVGVTKYGNPILGSC